MIHNQIAKIVNPYLLLSDMSLQQCVLHIVRVTYRSKPLVHKILFVWRVQLGFMHYGSTVVSWRSANTSETT